MKLADTSGIDPAYGLPSVCTRQSEDVFLDTQSFEVVLYLIVYRLESMMLSSMTGCLSIDDDLVAFVHSSQPLGPWIAPLMVVLEL